MTIPAIDHAQGMLAEAERMNPGPWVEHSRVAARMARTIAEKCGLDADAAFALALLHDIGRREGRTDFRHMVDGYRYLAAQGFDDAAAVCLTHAFPFPDVTVYQGEVDCSPADYAFLGKFLVERPYTDYDRLTQLCDSLALPAGPVLMEKRLVDVGMRRGLPEFTLRKWKANFELLRYFDEKVGGSVYALFPDVVQNTFGPL